MQIDPSTLQAIERHFHEVIRARAAEFVDGPVAALPDLAETLSGDESRAWFPVPGMYGGFSYWLDGEGPEIHLVAESWCRVCGGSGQRHIITANGSQLVEEGFA